MSMRSLANVFDAVMKNRCSDKEKEWINKIETLRNRLSTSTVEISLTDYGAGSSDSNLTAEEMYQGRVVVGTVGEICQSSSISYKTTFLLFKLVREFCPSFCLELGTALGISAAYQTAALELNQNGKIITLEGADSVASLAKGNFKELGFERIDVVVGRFQDRLKEVLRNNTDIDFVFIDGHHEENATIAYFKEILPCLSDNAILIFDNINWSCGMERAWNTIRKDKNLKVALEFLNVGICSFTKSKVEEIKHFKLTI